MRSFGGIGLRPNRVAHLNVAPVGGDLALTWVRRTRIDGDSWELPEVPLGEATESYLIRVTVNGFQRREVFVATPAWTYDAAAQAVDGATGTVSISVAQMSDRFGPGPFAALTLTL